MSEKFYTILTNVGLAAIANAQITQSKVDFSTFVVGDGNGAYYNPTSSQSALRSEVWRGPISGISIDDKNPNWIIVEAVIPGTVGGFSVREIGVLDSDGRLLAIGKVPETYKPASAEGSLKDLYLRMILEVSNASVVTLKVDPAVIFASKKYVDDQITINMKPLQNHINNTDVHTTHNEKNAWNNHPLDTVLHTYYGTASGVNAKTVTLSPAPTGYVEGMAVVFKNSTQNTSAVTLNINGLGAKPVIKSNGNAMSAGNLKVGSIYTVRYSGTSFILQGEGGEYGTAVAADVRSTKTFGTDDGIVQGTLDLSKLVASNIREGVSIDNVLGSLIPLSGEKKWASGTAVIGGRDLPCRMYDSSSFTNQYRLQVTGLDFIPSVIVIYGYYPLRSLSITAVDTRFVISDRYGEGYAIRTSSNTIMESGDIYINQGGFLLPMGSSSSIENDEAEWIAFE